MKASKKNTRSKNKPLAELFLNTFIIGGAEMISEVFEHYRKAGHIINEKKYGNNMFVQMSDGSVAFFSKIEKGIDVGCMNSDSLLRVLNDQYPFTQLEIALKHHNT